MKLITEQIEEINVLTEASESGAKNYFIEGIFLQGDIRNRNGRVYEKSILEGAVDKYVTETVSPVSKTNLPAKTFAVSFLGSSKSLSNSVDTVPIPATSRLW